MVGMKIRPPATVGAPREGAGSFTRQRSVPSAGVTAISSAMPVAM